MNGWNANYINNPNDDNLIIELLYNDVDVAIISRNSDMLELKIYANNEDLTIPVDWLSELLLTAKQSL